MFGRMSRHELLAENQQLRARFLAHDDLIAQIMHVFGIAERYTALASERYEDIAGYSWDFRPADGRDIFMADVEAVWDARKSAEQKARYADSIQKSESRLGVNGD